MFGLNEIHGKSTFKDAPKNQLKVTSFFYTIQGEGPYTGIPAFFIRLTHCSLNCSFCDAFFDQGEYYDFDFLINEAKKAFEGKGCRPLIVVTGGEPTLQDNLLDFLKKVDREWPDCLTQIETNGTQDLYEYWHFSTIVCSPKINEKTGKYYAMREGNLERVDALKVVVSANPESPYHQLPPFIDEYLKVGPVDREVYISPMNEYKKQPTGAKGTGDLEERSTVDEVIDFWSDDEYMDKKANELNHKYAGKLCMDKGYRLNLQQHVYLGVA